VGIFSPNEPEARRYVEMGFTFAAVGTDAALLRRGAQALLARFRGIVDSSTRVARGAQYARRDSPGTLCSRRNSFCRSTRTVVSRITGCERPPPG